MRRNWLCWVSLAAMFGCGRIGFEPLGSGAAPDAGVPLGSFGPPAPVAELSSDADELGPSLSADGTELYFTSNRGGSYTLYVAVRSDPDGPFDAPQPVSELDAGGIEYDAELSRDGRELYFVSSSAPAGLRRVTRSAVDDPWDGPLEIVAGGQEREGPSLMRGDARMLLSTPAGIEEWVRASPADPWAFVREHSTLAGMSWPGVSEDGLEVYATLRSSGELFRATRATVDSEFGAPVEVLFGSPLDPNRMVDAELSADGRTMYLSIWQGSRFDLYVTTR